MKKSIFDKIDKIYHGSQNEDEMQELIDYYGRLRDLTKRCAQRKLNKQKLNEKERKTLSDYCGIYLDTKRLTNQVIADIYQIILDQWTEAIILQSELKKHREPLERIF